MRILALITARGGSKRLPRKNIKILGNKPLIAWSIEVVNGIQDICDVLVSTDDSEIANISIQNGALVPWLRPENLSTDFSKSVDVALHALDWYEKEKGVVDGLLLLQPTSPFRKRESVLRGINVFKVNKNNVVLGVSSAKSHPFHCYYVEDSDLRPFIENKQNLRSQDLPLAYVVNGAFYLISPTLLRDSKSFHHVNMLPLLMNNLGEDLDIDTQLDWIVAESLIESGVLN